MTKQTIAVLACLLLVFAAYGQEESTGGETYTPSTTSSYSYGSSTPSPSSSSSLTRRFGVGYDEGIAARFFFNDRMGVQASVHFQYLGGYDRNDYNHGPQYEETDVGLGAAFLFNLFSHDFILLDGIGQVIVMHDGASERSDYGDRIRGYLRVALAPEILIVEKLALGLRFGLEVAARSSTDGEANVNGTMTTVDMDDATTDVRFFGPANPFDGAVLGMSLYYYF